MKARKRCRRRARERGQTLIVFALGFALLPLLASRAQNPKAVDKNETFKGNVVPLVEHIDQLREEKFSRNLLTT